MIETKIQKHEIFTTNVYATEKLEWVDKMNKISDEVIEEEKRNTWNEKIKKRNESLGVDVKDHGYSYHSKLLINDTRFFEFTKFTGKMCHQLLEDSGYDLTDYSLFCSNLWVQDFASSGGGHHDTHTHKDTHINGFYFLKCSNRTSFPILHDPRPAKSMIQLPEKDEEITTSASKYYNFKPYPGMLLIFPGYVPHQFLVDNGVDPFRFIHFNFQAINKTYKLNDI